MHRYLPSLSALRAFDAAARHSSFTKAADELGLTQSGISWQIRNLEAFLGLTLFHRSGPRIVLTDPGSAYFRDITQALDRLEEVSIDAVRGRRVETSVMLGAQTTFASHWLTPRLGGFLAAHPDIPLDLAKVTAEVDFDTTRIDIAVLRGRGSWNHAQAQELFAEELAVVASPALIPLGATFPPDGFAQFPLLQNAGRPSLWLQWMRMAGLTHKGRINGTRFADHGMLITAAVHGLGIAIVPRPYVEAELARGDLHMPFGPPVLSGESYFIVYPERKAHQQSIILLRDWLIRQTRSYRRLANARSVTAAITQNGAG